MQDKRGDNSRVSDKDLIFGIRPILEHIQGGKRVAKIWLQQQGTSPLRSELLRLAEQHEIPRTIVPAARLNRVTRKAHQGAIAWCSPVDYLDLADLVQGSYERGEVPLFIVLDRITNIGNLGAIARTALAAGVTGMILPIKEGATIDGNAMKASAGALAHLPLCRVKELSTALGYLKECGLQVVACTEKGGLAHWSGNLSGPTVLILGDEGAE